MSSDTNLSASRARRSDPFLRSMDSTRKMLTGAAADTFNSLSSPGQSLLQALQLSEVQRKERYAETVDAKMRAAREKLPALHPKHAVRSDQSIFASSTPSSEVHALLPSVRQAKVTEYLS